MPGAVDRGADFRRKSRYAPPPSITALGDFNMPKVAPEAPIYQAPTARGPRLPATRRRSARTSRAIGTTTRSSSSRPGETERALVESAAVFGFDGALFSTLWRRSEQAGTNDFVDYVRYYVSDHRILWTELRP